MYGLKYNSYFVLILYRSAPDLAKAFMKQDIPNNSLSLLGNIGGWCKLLMSTDKELNLQHRFSNNLYHSLNQST